MLWTGVLLLQWTSYIIFKYECIFSLVLGRFGLIADDRLLLLMRFNLGSVLDRRDFCFSLRLLSKVTLTYMTLGWFHSNVFNLDYFRVPFANNPRISIITSYHV